MKVNEEKGTNQKNRKISRNFEVALSQLVRLCWEFSRPQKANTRLELRFDQRYNVDVVMLKILVYWSNTCRPI